MNRMAARSALVTLGFLLLGLLQPVTGAARWHSISDFAHNVRSVCRDGIRLEVAFTGSAPQNLKVHVPPGFEDPVVAERTLVLAFNPITVDDELFDFHGFFVVRFDQRLAAGTRLGLEFDDQGVNDVSKFEVNRCLLSKNFHEDLEAELNGANELGTGDPNGSGAAKITLKPRSKRVCFELKWRKIGRPTAAHIRTAPAGANGPIVLDLLTSSDTIRHEDGRGRASGCMKEVVASLIRDFELHPATFYVNIETKGFPDGAIRGNLRKA